MEKWSTDPPGLYKITVSEWLLHSSKDDYLFSLSDKASHTPLLVHLNPRHIKPADVRAQMRTEKARRRERQRLNKAQGSGATSGTTDKHCTTTYQDHYSVGCGTAKNDTGRPSSAAPTTPPKASGTAAPVTPPMSAPAIDKGNSKAKGKKTTSDDAGKGKSTRAARRARRRARGTARAKARSECGLRRMLKDVSGISNRGPSQSVFTAPRGCE